MKKPKEDVSLGISVDFNPLLEIIKKLEDEKKEDEKVLKVFCCPLCGCITGQRATVNFPGETSTPYYVCNNPNCRTGLPRNFFLDRIEAEAPPHRPE